MRRLLLVLVLAGCSGDDDDCVPFEGTAPGLNASDGTAMIAFATLQSSPNNDCPGGGADVSLTVEGANGDARLVLCIPNPGSVGDGPLTVTANGAAAPSDRVELVNLFYMDAGCSIGMTEGATPTGTATFAGFCDAGGSRYQITLDVEVAGTRICGTEMTPVTLVLGGAAVASPPGM